LSSYGGELAFDIQHSCPGPLSTEPLVVIKGNRMTLVHHHRNGGRLPAGRTERITIDTYELSDKSTLEKGRGEEADGVRSSRSSNNNWSVA
uniref:Laminin IV type A domain-containing protein n=1 Tax=Toxocara canis TaxID=6265 RepID=A0A183U752_TOXCA